MKVGRLKDAETRNSWAQEHMAEVYRERDLLFCVLARMARELALDPQRPRWDAHLMPHTHAPYHPTVCIHTPAGQLTLPLRAEELQDLLADLPMRPNDWDRCKSKERYARLAQLAKRIT